MKFENEITVEVEYALEINNEHLADCHIRILANPKQNPEFLATITSNCYFPAFSLNIDMILSVTSSIPISEESR